MSPGTTTHRPAARLGCEPLEQRENPAGNVTAFLSGGTLVALGDAADNAVGIQQTAAGDIWMIGLNGTTVNGRSVVFVGRGFLTGVNVQMNGGNDFVELFNLFVGGDIAVQGGTGNDTIRLAALTGRNIAVDAGAGDDAVGTQGVVATSSVFLNGNLGFDVFVDRGVTAPARVATGFEAIL
jgi:hypothetical protein